MAQQAAPAGLTKGDRDRMLSALHATRKQVIDMTSGLSDAQWKFKPADDKWSIAEVVEHLALAEKAIFGMSQKALQSPPVSGEKKVSDEVIQKMLPSRDTKVKAPEMLVPTGRFGSGAKALAEFQTARDQSLQYVRTTKDNLRAHASQSVFGLTDGVQWIYYMAGHTERHVKQMAEVKADAKYPR